ncbi:S41 family peptidase [Hymenobacter psoromatis]|uniref:S41 family peptidase n=1 Tax=Hymenobacter psoromatis TaxID=1484116 RepID=UPI001CBBEBC1|nr:S41 family peptidase [Hymenobacter psoromatis]
MKKLLSLLLWLPLLGCAQAPTNCGCAQNFVAMRQLIETNYSGYRDKVTTTTRPRLDSLTAAIRAQADTAHAGNCGVVLYKWLLFFHDKHMALQNNSALRLDSAAIRAQYTATERLPWTRASFRQYLNDPARPKQPLEGIWLDGSGGGYVVGIVASGPAQYKGFVLKADSLYWLPGQVKFAFANPEAGPATARYYMRDHSVENRPVRVVRDGELNINGPWYRTYPRPVAVPPGAAPLSFQMLDDTTALYQIGSFGDEYRPRIDSITKANAANLARTKLLILDVRNNGGGSDGSYRSLAPYLYTGPVQETGIELWSTALNNSKYSGQLYPNMTPQEKKKYANRRKKLDARQGQFVNPDGKKEFSVFRVKRSQQHPALKRVAVLQNRYSGSTTEQFLLLARQSQKTTLFGENSYGTLDYSNLQFAELPCYKLRLGWPTSRSFRVKRGEIIDNVGIAPTVRLNPAAPNMTEQVRAWYRIRK